VAINSKYKIKEILGHGASGLVVKGVCRKTDKEVALKIIINKVTTESDCISILRDL